MSIFIRKREFLLLVSLFIIIALSIVIIATNKEKKIILSKAQETISPTPEASPSAQLAILEVETAGYNSTLLNLLSEYTQGDEAKKEELLPQLIQNAKERKQKMLEVLKMSPQSVYHKAFSREMLVQFPQEVQNEMEKRPEELIGQVENVISDYFEEGVSREDLFITQENTDEKVKFYSFDLPDFHPISQTKLRLRNPVVIGRDNNHDNENEPITQSFLYKPVVFAQEKSIGSYKKQKKYVISNQIEFINDATFPIESNGKQKVLVLLASDQSISPSLIGLNLKPVFAKINEFYEKASLGKLTFDFIKIDEIFKIKINSFSYDDTESDSADEVWRQVIEQAIKKNIDLSQYERFMLFTDLHVPIWRKKAAGLSTLGKSMIKIRPSENLLFSIKASRIIIYIANPYTFVENLLRGATVAIHELAHSIGTSHDRALQCKGNSFSFEEIISSCSEKIEYGHPISVMGYGKEIFSPSTLFEFDWYDNINRRIIEIDSHKPNGRYILNLAEKQGITAYMLRFGSVPNPINTARSLELNYFFEYRHNDDKLRPLFSNNISNPQIARDSLIINIDYKGQGRFSFPIYNPMIFPATTEKNKLRIGFSIGEEFTDRVNNLKMRVEKLNIDSNNDRTLVFSIRSCGNKQLRSVVNTIQSRAGDNQFTPSINVFENDLRGENDTIKPLTIKENFTVENNSFCFNTKYSIDQSTITVQQGNLSLSTPQFYFLSSEEIPPSQYVNNTFTIITTINNPQLQDSQMEFTVVEQTLRIGGQNSDKDKTSNNNKEEQPISKKLIYQFHVVPSTEEYRNDLEPHMIDIENKNINNKDFNHLETEKGQTLVFTSNIANNSRNPDGNKSIEFFVKWEIQDEKGNNVIPPFRQRHDGIPPKTLDDANPAILTWTIPQDFKAGYYKIILEVDSNNRLQEFNENNNMIFRYFSVVE